MQDNTQARRPPLISRKRLVTQRILSFVSSTQDMKAKNRRVLEFDEHLYLAVQAAWISLDDGEAADREIILGMC